MGLPITGDDAGDTVQTAPGHEIGTCIADELLEFAKPGELYMITQGGGGGYGDVLERDPELVSKDYLDGLISILSVNNIYCVLMDEKTGAVDYTATTAARLA